MATYPKTFREYYTVNPDPNASAPGAADGAFQATKTQQDCFDICDNPVGLSATFNTNLVHQRVL